MKDYVTLSNINQIFSILFDTDEITNRSLTIKGKRKTNSYMSLPDGAFSVATGFKDLSAGAGTSCVLSADVTIPNGPQHQHVPTDNTNKPTQNY